MKNNEKTNVMRVLDGKKIAYILMSLTSRLQALRLREYLGKILQEFSRLL